MWWIPWILSTGFFGIAVGFSYAIVLFNAFGDFPVSQGASTSYLDSPYWLGLPRSSTIAVAVFQVLAAIGYIAWQFSLIAERPTRGIFTDTRWLIFANSLFLVPSIAWPFAAHRLLKNTTSLSAALLSSSCLWLAAVGVSLLVGGTFEDHRETPVALVGILLTGTVVVVADGAGWSATAIYGALN